MIKRALLGLLGLVALAIAYLLAWPVAIAPVAWDPPEDRGYTGAFASNTALAALERLELGLEPSKAGPEDIAARDGRLYASSASGRILTLDPVTGEVRVFADTGGLPLGMEFDAEGNLLVADAARGLLRIGPDGGIELLTDSVNGTPIPFADDVDIGPDGVVYFSDASTKFGAVETGSPTEASLHEIMEHARTGRLLAFDPASGATTVVADGLAFPNGVAITADGEAVLVNITGEYNTLRIPVAGGRRTGEITEFAANYPGFPDNINPGPPLRGEATYIVGLVSPRSADLDRLAARPALRKMVWRLPEALRPAAADYTHIVILGEDGRVLRSLQDPSGAYAQATGGIVMGGDLYLSSLTETAIARLPLADTLTPDTSTPDMSKETLP